MGRVDDDSADFDSFAFRKLQENDRSYRNKVMMKMEILLRDMFVKEDWHFDSSDSVFQTEFGESFNQHNYFFVSSTTSGTMPTLMEALTSAGST